MVKGPDRSKETLFQVAYQNQVNLIQIADNKANMIISINTMIISSIIAITGFGAVSERIEYGKSSVIIPITVIILTCLLSVIFAVMAARPKLVNRRASMDPSLETSSLLFFGRIALYTQEAYLGQMETLLLSEKEIYRNMTMDIYNQGLILKRKYYLISYAYKVFMMGFIFSVFVFLGFLAFG